MREFDKKVMNGTYAWVGIIDTEGALERIKGGGSKIPLFGEEDIGLVKRGLDRQCLVEMDSLHKHDVSGAVLHERYPRSNQ